MMFLTVYCSPVIASLCGVPDILLLYVFVSGSYSYDVSGRKSAVSLSIVFTRDTVAPTISSITAVANSTSAVTVTVNGASDVISGIGTANTTYTYYQESTQKGTSASNTYQYTGLGKQYYTIKATVKDKAGNVCEKTKSILPILDFAYTGSAQSFTLQPGKYKLEVWGAQGGGNVGGKGGYSVGDVRTFSSVSFSAIVGGQGPGVVGRYRYGFWRGRNRL